MQKQNSLTVEGVQFNFENNLLNGAETLSVDGQVVSSVKSSFGGKHEFTYRGDAYRIKVRPGILNNGFKVQKNGVDIKPVVTGEKIPVVAHIFCGWPLILILLGGAIGGGLGGAAYMINLFIYRSNLSKPLKYLLNIAVGSGAVVLWLVFSAVILTWVSPK